MENKLKKELKKASKEMKKMEREKVNWEKVLICGVVLGYMISMLYLMLILTAELTY